MLNFLNVLEVIVAILLIFIILVQNKNVTLNLSSMGGWMGPVTKRGPEKFFQTATIVLGALFILNSILLFIL